MKENLTIPLLQLNVVSHYMRMANPPCVIFIRPGEVILILDAYDEASAPLKKVEFRYEIEGELQSSKTIVLHCGPELTSNLPSYATTFKTWYEQWDKTEGRTMSKAYLEISGLLSCLQHYQILIFDRIDKPSQGVFLLELLTFLKDNDNDLPLPAFVLLHCGDVPVLYANADRILDVASGDPQLIDMEAAGF